MIGTKLNEGWRTAYSDGSGCGGFHAAASHITSRRADEQATTVSQYIGTLASVADAERMGLALSLEANQDRDMVLLLRQHGGLQLCAPPHQREASQIRHRRETSTGPSKQDTPGYRHKLGSVTHRHPGQRSGR